MNYQYSALPQGSFIRYLILKAGQGDEVLECSLCSHSLDEPPDHEAISYVWGQPERNHIILCDGHVIKITQNLSNVLRRLRLSSKSRALWADSICINQEDMEEKGQQVALMARIYRNAKRTLIYLGDEKEGHAKAAVELIKEINMRIVKTCERKDRPWTLFPWLEPEDPVLSDTRWKSVALLYSSAWFGRGWTVQEAALAQEGLAIWGQYEICWAMLMRFDAWATWRAPSCVQKYGIDAPALHWYNYFGRNQHEARFFREDKYLPAVSLLNTLESVRTLGLTDPKDRIYAFLEVLVSDGEGEPETGLQVRTNYLQSFLDVYKDFAIEHIQKKRKVELLDYVQHTQQTLDAKLPSWVPRWDIRLEGGCRLYIPRWQALTDRSLSIHGPSMIGTKLSVRATVLDSIVHVSEVITPEVTLDDIAQIWKTVVQINIPTPYPPLYRLHAFMETLRGDISQGDVETFRRSQAAYLLEIHQKTSDLEAIDIQYWKETAKYGDVDFYHSLIRCLLPGKRIFLTQRGYLGAAYSVTRTADRCGIIFGCKTPSVLRHTETENTYKLLGGAYITGTTLQIDREIFRGFTLLGRKESKDWTEWDVQEEDIVLC
ncbi:heterokaryon incompatibility protein 6,OR allele [Cladorrhinum samala]|uniref:Heterokaryon incompatibility protein 6,OR allele n=1 Tax=Cladorrhinum samala TaxID=585594 RepID=A0AAV9HAM2_9PEZI|nr:heterokaryon incompatibility protein 6,OR allele [Cladorrhinum samala]